MTVAKAERSGKSKRKQTDGKKSQRAASRRRADRRHDQLAGEQELRHRANLQLMKDGKPLPWEQACAERAARRLSTCGKCRVLFGDGICARCGGTANLAAAWADKHKTEPLPAA